MIHFSLTDRRKKRHAFRQHFPERIDSGKEQIDRRQRIDPQFRCRRGVGSLPVEHHIVTGDRAGTGVRRGPVGGMDHHGGIDPFQTACLNHFDFAPVGFLRRRTQQDHLAGQLLLFHRLCHRAERGKSGSTDQIVSAGMSHIRQSIVLRKDGKDGRTGAVFRAEGGFEPAIGIDHSKALFLQKILRLLHGKIFLIRQFGMIPDRIGKCSQTGGDPGNV